MSERIARYVVREKGRAVLNPREIERDARVGALDELIGAVGSGLTTTEAVCWDNGWVACLRWLGTLTPEDLDDVLALERES